MRIFWLINILLVPPFLLFQEIYGSPIQVPQSPSTPPISSGNILDDKNYLETIQSELEGKVSDAREEMIERAKAIETVTRQYAKAKITQNLVKALRVLLEKEMKKIPMKVRIREPRQEEEEQESGGQDEEASGSSSGNQNQEGDRTQNQAGDKEEGQEGPSPPQSQNQNVRPPTGNRDKERPDKNKESSGNSGEKTSTEAGNSGSSTTENPESEVTDSSGNEVGGSGGGEDEEGETTTPKVTLESTSLFGSIAAVLKTIVGGENGTKPLNLTHTLNYASDLILKPLGNFKPFAGVGSLLGFGGKDPEESTRKPVKPKIQYIPVYITIPPETTESTTLTQRKYPHRPLIGAFVGRSLWRSGESNGTVEEEQTTVQAQTEKIADETEAPETTSTPVEPETPPEQQPIETSSAPTKSKQPVHYEIEEIFPVPEVTNEPPKSSINHRTPTLSRPGSSIISEFRPIASVFAEPPPPTPATEPPTVEPEIIQTPEPTSNLVQQALVTGSPAAVTVQTPTQPTTLEPVDIDSQEYEEFETEETTKPPRTTTTKKPKPVRTKPTTTTTTPKPQPGIIYIDNFAEDVQKGIDGIVKNLPDLLKSAQQAIGLLQGLRGLFGGGGSDGDSDDG